MPTDLSFVHYIVDQSQLGDRLTWKKMFGEYALYLGGRTIALACDNSLFVKPAPVTDQLTANLPLRSPYPGAKPHPVADELLDEPEQLRRLLLETEKAVGAPKRSSRARRDGK